MYSKSFEELAVGRLFRSNGNEYQKQSKRTARLLMNGRVFYFKKLDVVHPVAN